MDVFPCDGCAAPCCRQYTIYLDGGDAYRIARALKLPMEDFLSLSPGDGADERWAVRLDDGGARYRLHLKKVPDPDPQYPGRCPFLISVGERGRCGIYPVRPSACAAYPTSWSGGLVGLGDGGDYCPPGAWQLESLDVPAFRLWHRRKRQGAVVYRALVDGWNARLASNGRPESERRFYHFLFNAYRELEAQAPELLAEAPLDAPAGDQAGAAVERVLAALGWLGVARGTGR